MVSKSVSFGIITLAFPAANPKLAAGTIFSQATQIASGTDLNDLGIVGSYFTNSKSITESLLNKPNDVNGIGILIFVLNPYGLNVTNYRTQIIICKDSIYVRWRAQQDWYSWTKLATVS